MVQIECPAGTARCYVSAMAHRSTDRPYVALAWMACSALGFSLMAIFVKRLGDSVPQFELVFFRSLLNFLFVLVWMLARRESLAPPRGSRKILVYRGLAGFSGVSCLFYSITHLPLPVAMLLGWSSPLFVLLFSRLFLHERTSARGLGFAALAFLGLLLILNPDPRHGWVALPIGAVAVSLFGAASAGSAYVAVRAATAKVGPNLIVLCFVGIATLLSAPLAALDFRPLEPGRWGEVVLLGIFATIGQVTMTQGYRFAPAGRVSTMSLLNAAFSALLGWALFSERLELIQWGGLILMASAIAALTWSGNSSLAGQAGEADASGIKLRYE